MLWNPLAAICGLVFCSMMGVILVSSVRRSPFGWLIISVEYFYVLGMGVYPLVLSLGIINTPEVFVGYEARNGELQGSTFVHILLYGLGALLGYFMARPFARRLSQRITLTAMRNRINNYVFFYWILGLSILASLLYFSLVGLDVALLNASRSRGGDFSGLVGFEQYQFLVRLAMIGVFAMAFVPYVIIDGHRVLSSFMLVAVVALLIYLQTVARAAILEMIGVFFILYFCFTRRRSTGFPLLVVSIAALMLFIFVYGKAFVGVLSAFLFTGADFELVRGSEGDDAAAYFFGHFGYLVYSIDAGIRHFFSSGPTLPKDVLLSPLGIVPSFTFSAVGLEFLSYQMVPSQETFACINTDYLGSWSECFAPPYFPGVSAYVLPFGGALVFGFVRFCMYSVIENCWLSMKTSPELLWFPYLAFLILLQVMLVIPTAISFAVFASLVFFVILSLRRLLIAAAGQLRFPISPQ